MKLLGIHPSSNIPTFSVVDGSIIAPSNTPKDYPITAYGDKYYNAYRYDRDVQHAYLPIGVNGCCGAAYFRNVKDLQDYELNNKGIICLVDPDMEIVGPLADERDMDIEIVEVGKHKYVYLLARETK